MPNVGDGSLGLRTRYASSVFEALDVIKQHLVPWEATPSDSVLISITPQPAAFKLHGPKQWLLEQPSNPVNILAHLEARLLWAAPSNCALRQPFIWGCGWKCWHQLFIFVQNYPWAGDRSLGKTSPVPPGESVGTELRSFLLVGENGSRGMNCATLSRKTPQPYDLWVHDDSLDNTFTFTSI